MENRVNKIVALGEGLVSVSFDSGDVYEYDLNNISAVIPDYKVAANPNDEKLNIATNGDGFIVNKEIVIDIEEILDSGTLVEHKVPGLYATFGNMMKATRKAKGLKQCDIAELTGIYQTDISKYEHGIGNITIGTMKKLSDAIGMNVEFAYSDKKSYEFRKDKVADILASYVASDSTQGSYSIADVKAIYRSSRPADINPVLIDGALYNEGAKTGYEDKIASHFQFELNKFINKNKGKCIVSKNLPILSYGCACDYILPSLTVVCDPSKITSAGIVGAPDFVLDIISAKSTAKTAYKNKLGKYMSMGVRECWILDVSKKQVTVYGPSDDYCPVTYSLNDKVSIGIFDDQLKIDLKQIVSIIDEK